MRSRGGNSAAASLNVRPNWSDPNLPPDQFLYQRSGPWPQPAPAYPMSQAPEVLNIPPIEALLWNNTIGARYLQAQNQYPPDAAKVAIDEMGALLPTDEKFVAMMTHSVYGRFLRPDPKNASAVICDFSAMQLIEPLPGTHCAPVKCSFTRDATGDRYSCTSIEFTPTDQFPHPLLVEPGDKAWNLAKIYALQGAAYHALFVVHPALHFPMDSVNAITKTAIPHTHPLFQLLYPHTTYTLALDNAVQEGAASVVSNNAPGTWFDPLTANAYNVKQLFGVGYAGYAGDSIGYPPYDYLNPWMNGSTLYGKCLAMYFQPFAKFCGTVADRILEASPDDTYVERWANYNRAHVRGFPDGKSVMNPDVLAKTMAIYLWDVTVSHGADHYSFANDISVGNKFLRIRKPRPLSRDEGADIQRVGDACDADDLARSALAQYMFFSTWTMSPNLIDTKYAFTDPLLQEAVRVFHADLEDVAKAVAKIAPGFMPLKSADYSATIPASIQY